MILYFFQHPRETSSEILFQIEALIREGGAVGPKFIRENLRNAFLIGYAMDGDRVVGSVTLKNPPVGYRNKIEAATGLDLSGYLERGYTSVAPSYRCREIADRLIKGLSERAKGQKIYVTIRMDNIPPIKLAYNNHMKLAGVFTYRRTGHEIGVFINRREECNGT